MSRGVLSVGGTHPLPSPPPGRGRGLLMRCPMGARPVWGVGFLDSGLRRNDGLGLGVGLLGQGWYWHGFLDSGLRRNDGGWGLGCFGWETMAGSEDGRATTRVAPTGVGLFPATGLVVKVGRGARPCGPTGGQGCFGELRLVWGGNFRFFATLRMTWEGAQDDKVMMNQLPRKTG